jgi:hypothetical protein
MPVGLKKNPFLSDSIIQLKEPLSFYKNHPDSKRDVAARLSDATIGRFVTQTAKELTIAWFVTSAVVNWFQPTSGHTI